MAPAEDGPTPGVDRRFIIGIRSTSTAGRTGSRKSTQKNGETTVHVASIYMVSLGD